MRLLYIGDIMGKAGRRTVSQVLPKLLREMKPDFVIAQVENIDDDGKGPSTEHLEEMRALGVDFFSGGNHSLLGKGSKQVYENKTLPIVRPANLKTELGDGYRIVVTPHGKLLITSILGQTVGSRTLDLDNPLEAIDKIVNVLREKNVRMSIVNFHGDFSSEKRVFGYYLDGTFSAVIGDHWHVPTADAMILPGGTAHISDVGMCGSLHSSLGVKTQVIIDRWKSGKASRNEMEDAGPLQFNALLVTLDPTTGHATEVEHIQRIIDK